MNLATGSTFNSIPIISTEKLVGSINCTSWTASVELWCMGQGLEDHQTTRVIDLKDKDSIEWKKIDALLYKGILNF